MNRSNPVEGILAAVGSFLPAELSADIRKNVMGSVRTSLENMDFVTRSELEVQEVALRRAREKLKQLEARIEQLEKETNP